MKLNWNDFGRKCQFPVLFACGMLPAPMLICANAAPESLLEMLVLTLVYVLAAWGCILIPGKLRLLAAAVCSAGLAGLGVALLPAKVFTLLVPAVYVAVLLAGLCIGGWDRGQELHPAVGTVCLLAHMVAQFMVNTSGLRGDEAAYAPVTLPLILAFIGFAALSLLSMNRISLNCAVNGKQGMPVTIRRKNLVLAIGMLVITLSLAAIPAVIGAIRAAWAWIRKMIGLLLQWLSSLFQEEVATGYGGGGSNMELGPMEATEPSLFLEILEKIVMGLTVVALVVAAFFFLRLVYKKLRALLKVLWERLNAYLATSSEDYVDEIADTRDEGILERAMRRRRRRAEMRRVDESTLSPAGRIRYRYWLAGQKHPEWKIESTARENLPEEDAQIYERARYSNHEMTAREAEDFASRVK